MIINCKQAGRHCFITQETNFLKMGDFFQSREWMYKRLKRSDHSLCENFIEGVKTFISFACNQAFFLSVGNCSVLVKNARIKSIVMLIQ